MKKTITDILWEEIKVYFYEVRCQGLSEDKKHDFWSKYQIDLMGRVGEDDKPSPCARCEGCGAVCVGCRALREWMEEHTNDR